MEPISGKIVFGELVEVNPSGVCVEYKRLEKWTSAFFPFSGNWDESRKAELLHMLGKDLRFWIIDGQLERWNEHR